MSIKNVIWVVAMAMAPLLAGKAVTPSEAEKALAASIASAPSPAEVAAGHAGEWSAGLSAALTAEAIARENKDLAGAEKVLRLSVEVAAKAGDAAAGGLALAELGALLRSKPDFPEATALLRKAVVMQATDATSSKDEIAELCRTEITLTLVLHDGGQDEEGEVWARRAVEAAEAVGDVLLKGRAYSAAGSASTGTGNHRAAVSYLQKALAAAEELKSLNGQAVVLNNLGVAARHVYDYDGAAQYFERSLAIKRQQGPTARLSTTLNNLGELAMMQAHNAKAEEYFRQAIEAAQSPADAAVRAGALINIGLIGENDHDFVKAREALGQGIAIAEKIGDGGSVVMARLVEAAVDVDLHKPEDAQADIDLARKMVDESGDRRMVMRYTVAQGDVYREQKLIDKARAEYLKAVDQYEALRLDVAGDESTQADYADNSRYVYTTLIRLDAESGRTEDAFHYAELSKSRVLLDDLISGRGEMTSLLTAAEAARNKELLATLAGLNARLRVARGAERTALGKQLDRLRFDYAGFRVGVYAAHPELALRRADPVPVTAEKAAALLPDEHTALISYAVGENATYGFLVMRAAGKPVVRMRELKTDVARLLTQVSQLRGQIASRDLGFTRLAEDLYTTLVRPFQTDLAGAKIERLTISPDGPLWQLPFEALRDGAGKFLTESYEVFYVPSATVLEKMQAASRGQKGPMTVLALGNPTGDLPEAAAEVTAIGKLYGPGRSKVLTGAAATEVALRAAAGGYSVIHIAAHGKYDDARPLYSYLALAGSAASAGTDAEDGNLEAREIMDLQLKARLVILSGCETARGSASGVGIAGMTWAIFIAGAPATVASLWKVDSKSTEMLMVELHRGLARGETASKALRAAKLELLRDPAYRHPFYWAGFIGLGAGI